VSFVASPHKPAYGVGSRRTSYVMPSRSNLPGEGVPLNVIQRQLGRVNLGTTSIYLQGIDTDDARQCRTPVLKHR
jgi:hypothetical protein